MREPILTVKGIHKDYHIKTGLTNRSVGRITAVDKVDLEIYPNETLGLVGESGCGKSTLARLLLMLERPDYGRVMFDGYELRPDMDKIAIRHVRRGMQVIFQDPFGSLSPRKKVISIIEEPLIVHAVASRKEIRKRALELLGLVGLPLDVANRYPHEFSGGQRQRIGIARALALEPRLLICDEPVSSLDVSIQAQVLNLLVGLQQKLKLSYLFISHDISVVNYVSDRIAVMYMGKIVELGPTDTIINTPMHPYTRCLLASIPRVGQREKRINCTSKKDYLAYSGTGCSYLPRCDMAMDICSQSRPRLEEKEDGHLVACHAY